MGLLCLDLDGTLVGNTLEEIDGKLQRAQTESFTRPTLLPNRYEVLERGAGEGDCFAIVSNQGGVAWGYHTQAEVFDRIGHTVAQLNCFWGRPFSVHIAWMMEKGNLLPQFKGDDGRKPSPFMLGEALGWYSNVSLTPNPAATAIMVGDRDEDREAAGAAGIDFADADAFFEVPF